MEVSEEVGAGSLLRCVEIKRTSSDVSCGFHLSRSKWDPYPWVSGVEESSPADEAGVRAGDCLLEVNGEDIVGRKICDVAELVKTVDPLELMLWNAGIDSGCTPEALCCGPMPLNMQRLSACMSSVIGFLECPVCLTTICPPACQCVNGHLLCIRCHAKSERCPVCRVKLSRGRCLFADQVFNSLVDSFGLNKKNSQQQISDKIRQMFKQKSKWKDLPIIKVSQPKFLQSLLVDRALSAENLSGNGWRQAQAARVARAFLGEPNLKTKSLSACDISGSRLSSRSCSRNNLQMTSSMERIPTFDNNTDNILYYCPFESNCCDRILLSEIMTHFQQIHKNSPLVQYFTSDAVFKLFQPHETTYYFTVNGKSFFLKILTPEDYSESSSNGILIWMWFLGDSKSINEYHLDLSLRLKNTETSLINMSSTLFSLENWSWDCIQKNQKGSFISLHTVKALSGENNDNLYLEVKIRHSSDSQ